MTITTHDGLAILPKRCNDCNRLFWLEPYDVYYREVGIEHYSLKQIKCLRCPGTIPRYTRSVNHEWRITQSDNK